MARKHKSRGQVENTKTPRILETQLGEDLEKYDLEDGSARRMTADIIFWRSDPRQLGNAKEKTQENLDSAMPAIRN